MDGEPERREDYTARDRIDDVAERLMAWATNAQLAQEQHFEESAEIQAAELDRVAGKLTRGQIIGLIVLVVSLSVSGIALGKALGRQDAIEAQAATLSRQQATIAVQATRLREVVGQIREQRVQNAKDNCAREEKGNRNLVGLLGAIGASDSVLVEARKRYPAKVDCRARVKAVEVQVKP